MFFFSSQNTSKRNISEEDSDPLGKRKRLDDHKDVSETFELIKRNTKTFEKSETTESNFSFRLKDALNNQPLQDIYKGIKDALENVLEEY